MPRNKQVARASRILKKYGVNESHSEWNPTVDNWMSVELYRVMHNGELPPEDDMSLQYVLDFLDDNELQLKLLRERPDFGSLYLTAKRMLYRYRKFL